MFFKIHILAPHLLYYNYIMKLEIESISLKDSRYPSLLREIQNPPQTIYLLGDLTDDLPRIAIVGTRKATLQGRLIAKEMAKKLSEQGLVIVSGLAMGIDTAAHEGGLAGNGRTIAVLARGLDEIYPRQNENLANKILEKGGAIISEYQIGIPPYPNQFLERNRIISGLCIATIIVEAPQESGSLVTARLSAEQGREIFVVPGPIDHPNYRGSHKLIRDGARLVGSVEDILEDLSETLNLQLSLPNQTPKLKFDEIKDDNQLLIIETIKKAGQPINIDKIIEATKLEPQMVNQSLALLIVQGTIKETEKGYVI
jgi:DNA processing protein